MAGEMYDSREEAADNPYAEEWQAVLGNPAQEVPLTEDSEQAAEPADEPRPSYSDPVTGMNQFGYGQSSAADNQRIGEIADRFW